METTPLYTAQFADEQYRQVLDDAREQWITDRAATYMARGWDFPTYEEVTDRISDREPAAAHGKLITALQFHDGEKALQALEIIRADVCLRKAKADAEKQDKLPRDERSAA